ncbi:unnamed protein product [Schistosoma margrebowiei]|uniref:Uncharacterized protein n=1 Tax=Schistosoma margrebowiei TaxID=48269 RepID=A0A183MLW0_9TREM|nr:unnamed protein product [Schistosoma margrebowiei]
MATATLEAFRANRRWVPTEINMHPDRPHDARIKRKGKLELTIPLVDCLDNKITCSGQGLPYINKLPVHSHESYTDKMEEARAFHNESIKCL